MKKFLQVTFGLIMLLGLIIMIGTAGASDTGYITFDHASLQACIGVALLGLGGIGLKVTNRFYV